MMRMRIALALGVALAIVASSGAPAQAQATRTWVSGVGSDANPCSRTAPCKTFAGAISSTAPGGEIDALDPGGFGAVTITKAITLDGAGTLAGILASLTNGIIVNAGASDRVVLRNLLINGGGNGLNGIRFLAGKSLHVENCVISGFTTTGIEVTGAGQVFLSDTSIRNVAGIGIDLSPTTGTVNALLDGVRVEASGTGVSAQGNVLATFRNTSASGNDAAGFAAQGAGVELSLNDALASGNQTGVQAGGGARVRLTRVTLTNNLVAGLATDTGAEVVPFTENLIAGNPPGSTVCDLTAALSAVGCPGSVASCPQCPAPVCEAPVIGPGIGPCKRCRTKHGVTTCLACTIAVQ